jgi:drug/metabolite transporter (DMT)-like permease
VLVTTGPVWVALLGSLFLRERISRRAGIGIALSLAGALVISGGDFGSSAEALLGDAMALGGAVAAAVYVLAGRSLRPRMSLSTYTGTVYALATIGIGALMLVAGTPFGGFEPRVWGLFALMTLGPQIGGHTVFNYLLAHVEAVVVSIAVTAEPVGATLLALVFLRETPSLPAVVGGVVILAGVYLAISARAGRKLEEAAIE